MKFSLIFVHTVYIVHSVNITVFVMLVKVYIYWRFFITGSIARSASRRYLVYSEADFEVFRPAGATRCIDGVKFGMEGPACQISPPSVHRQGCRTPKTEIFTHI